MNRSSKAGATPRVDVDRLIRVESDADLARVGAMARAEGITVNRELRRSKLLDVSGSLLAIDRLAQLPEVQSIRESTSYTLPPMDDHIPQ